MPAYMQQRILDALEAALKAAPTGCGTRVFVDRTDALQPDELPAILIEAREEQVSPALTMARPYLQVRTFDAVVAPCVGMSNGAGAALREICLQIEIAIYGDAALNDLARQVPQLLGSQTASSGEGDTVLKQQPMVWRFPYRTLSNQPDTPV